MSYIHCLKLASLLVAASLCGSAFAVDIETGVSKKLTEYRAAHITNPQYTLSFSIPDQKDEPVTGTAVISFGYDGTDDLQLDFQGKLKDGQLQAVVNGKLRAIGYRDEHLIVSRKHLKKKGKENQIAIEFVSSDNALNRNDEYLYTLFVPDHGSKWLDGHQQREW